MGKARILVVDDEPGILAFVGACLRQEGYEVIEASDGEQGLQVMEETLPALVLLDRSMPRLDGFEVCRRIREWSQVPIIMISAGGGEQDKAKALRLGADDYLVKPFGLDELTARVKAMLCCRQTADGTGGGMR